MKLFSLLFLAALIFPALAFGQTVTITGDTGASVTLDLDATAQTVYARLKANPDFGSRIVEVLVQDWLKHHKQIFTKADGLAVEERLEALSSTDKDKVMDQLALCEAGPC